MAFTFQEEVSNGVQTVYPVDFDFQSTDTVYVYTGEHTGYATQISYRWIAGNTEIELLNLSEVPNGTRFYIRRVVPRDDLIHKFENKSIRGTLIDAENRHALYLMQEVLDGFLTLADIAAILSTLDMNDNRIERLADPEEATDAVTRRYLEARVASLISDGSDVDFRLWGDRFRGTFSQGFVYITRNDVARGDDGRYYRYVGTENLPYNVSEGTNPAGTSFEEVGVSDARGTIVDSGETVEARLLALPGEINADGEAAAAVDGHNADNNAHEQLFTEAVANAGTNAQSMLNAHNSASDAHPELTATIQAEVDRAVNAANSATGSANIYGSVAEGLSETVVTDQFQVLSADGLEYIRYRHDTGPSATEVGRFPTLLAVTATYTQLTEQTFRNFIANGDFLLGDPVIRSSSTLVDLTQQPFLDRGYRRGIQWRLGNEFAVADMGVNVNGMWVGGCVLCYSTNPASLPSAGTAVLSEFNGTTTPLANRVDSYIDISSNLRLVYTYGQVSQANADALLVGSTETPSDNTLYASGFFLTARSGQFDILAMLAQVLLGDRVRKMSLEAAEGRGYMTSAEVETRLDEYSNDDLPSAMNIHLQETYVNSMKNGDFIVDTPRIRSGSEVVTLSSIPEFDLRGIATGINLRTSGNEFVFAEELGSLANKYVLGAYYVHSPAAEFPPIALTLAENSSGGLGALTEIQDKTVDISSTFKLLMYTGKVTTADPVNIAIGNSYVPTSTELRVGGYFLIISDEPIDFDVAENNIYLADKSRRQAAINRKGQVATTKSTCSIASVGHSLVTGYKDGYKVTREVDPFPAGDIETPYVFNFISDKIDDVVVKTMVDDVAPQRALGTTIGANHGYLMGQYVAASHGKTEADVGSIWAIGGNQFIILGIRSADTIWIAHLTNNSSSALITGTMTHVSGAANTASFTVTSVTVKQAYPPFQNYSMRVQVDGNLVSSGDYGFEKSVKFIESYDILARDEWLGWYQDDYTTGGVPSGRVPSYSVSMVYEFDTEANCTIYSDIAFVEASPVADLMFMQAQRNELDRYYLPKTLPFVHDGENMDYSRIEPARKLTDNSLSTVYFTSDRLDATGIPVDRFVGLNDGSSSFFTMGYLPEQSGEEAVRRANTTAFAWEIRGSSDKMYPRLVDIGNFTAAAGTYYSMVGYRNVAKQESGITAKYPVRASTGDYYYMDWHDLSDLQRIALPSDYHGKEFVVVEQRNVTLYSQTVTDSVLVQVDCTGDYAYLVLKMVE